MTAAKKWSFYWIGYSMKIIEWGELTCGGGEGVNKYLVYGEFTEGIFPGGKGGWANFRLMGWTPACFQNHFIKSENLHQCNARYAKQNSVILTNGILISTA